MSRLPSLGITIMLITLGVELPAKQAIAAPIQITTCRTISAPGSYILANNLIANGNCLVVATPFVTINLNGFELRGNGTGFGIVASGFQKGITVRNGTIRNFVTGVSLRLDSLVERMYITDNKEGGVAVGGSSIVRDNIITDNGTGGVSAGDSLTRGTIVTGNTVARNGFSTGVEAGAASIVIGNVSTSSQNGDGFDIRGGSLVINNVASDNTGSLGGFSVGADSIVENNAAFSNSLRGFILSCPSIVVENSAAGDGIFLSGSGCVDEDNLP